MLTRRLQKTKENASPTGVESGDADDKEPPPLTDNLASATCAKTPQEVPVECSLRSCEVYFLFGKIFDALSVYRCYTSQQLTSV